MRQRNAVDLPLSGPDFFDLRRGATTMFEDFAAVQTGRTVVRQEDGTVEQVRFASVSPNFLTLLGGAVVIGRTFTDADGQPLADKEAGPPGQPYLLRSTTVAMLSYDYWQRRYGGSAAVLGQGLAGRGAGAIIVGVLAPGFELLFPPKQNVERWPDVWVAAPGGGTTARRRPPRDRAGRGGGGGRRAAAELPALADRRIPHPLGAISPVSHRAGRASTGRVDGRGDLSAPHRLRERRQSPACPSVAA
jgi:hypothetical protein